MNPPLLPGKGMVFSVKGIKVVTSATIQADHLWVGVRKQKRSRKDSYVLVDSELSYR